jgi:hypothetical protein
MRFGFVVIVLALLAVLAAGASADESRPGERYVSVQWDRAEGDTSRGRTIPIRYTFWGYACQYRFHRVSVRETSTTVTIKVLAHRREMRSDEVCPAVVGGGSATVKLKRPLGNRRLRKAPKSDPGT